MHWAAVFLVAYAAGLVEFWHLCDTAPLMHDDQPGTTAQEFYRPSNHVSAQPRMPIQPTTTTITVSRIAAEPKRANSRRTEAL